MAFQMKLITRYLLLQFLSISFLLGEFFLFDIRIQHADAWWDEAHLLVGAIAELQLEPDVIAKIETQLSKMEYLFPGMSEIWSSAIWGDHIKCGGPSIPCSGQTTYDSFLMTKTWHFLSVPINPQNITLEPIDQLQPLPMIGAPWRLTTAMQSIPNLNWNGAPSERDFTDDLVEDNDKTDFTNRNLHKYIVSNEILTEDGTVCNLDDVSDPSTITDKVKEPNMEPWNTGGIGNELDQLNSRNHQYSGASKGSIYGFNTVIRLINHLMGDIHQPLHVLNVYSHVFPKGDFGGNKIHTRTSSWQLRNLHAIWDSVAGTQASKWDVKKKKEYFDTAKRLISEYPSSAFGKRLKGKLNGLNFEEIAKDSSMLHPIVYSEFQWNNFTWAFLPYTPSDCYMKKVTILAEQQIALGGYRLANLLRYVSSSLPSPAMPTQSPPNMPQKWNATLSLLLVVTIMCIICSVYYFRHVIAKTIFRDHNVLPDDNTPVVDNYIVDEAQPYRYNSREKILNSDT